MLFQATLQTPTWTRVSCDPISDTPLNSPFQPKGASTPPKSKSKKVNTPQTNTANDKCADTKTPHVRNSVTSLNINFRSFLANRDTFLKFISIPFPTPRYHFWYRNLAH